MGVFDVLDILNHFAIITNVITLDRSYLKTQDLTEMKYAATQNEYGYNLMAPSAVVNCLVQLLTNPGSPEEAYKMNTALKTLDIKKNGNSEKFYELLEEALSRTLLFQKMAQIYSPLTEEVKTNKELIRPIILVNNKLIDMTHLEELAGSSDTELRIAHYIIHNLLTGTANSDVLPTFVGAGAVILTWWNKFWKFSLKSNASKWLDWKN